MTNRQRRRSFHARTIDVDGLQVRLHDSSTRGPVSGKRTFVLVHGLGVSSRYFHPLSEALTAHGRVVAVDLPGFGKTQDPDRSLRISEFARVLGQTVRLTGGDDVVLLGHSMGCQVVVEALLQDPALARSAVLAAPVVNADERSTGVVLRRFVQSAIREPLPSAFASVAAFSRCGPRWLGLHIPAMVGYRIEERIEGVTVPVLLVGGPLDRLAPPAWVEQLAGRVAGPAPVHIIDGAAHQMIFTNAAEVADLVASFAAEAAAATEQTP